MFRPRRLDEDGHHDRGENRVAGVVGEADGQEAEDERMGNAPVPEILVQHVNSGDQQEEEDFFHLAPMAKRWVVVWM